METWALAEEKLNLAEKFLENLYSKKRGQNLIVLSIIKEKIKF
jgi:hypothetical protein